MSGYSLSYRSKWNHPLFRDLREAGIWAWLCETAVWKDCRINFNGEIVSLKRGQIITSVRFIAAGFKVGEQVIRTLMDRMETDKMITRQPTHKGTIITICNYDKYQIGGDTDNTQSNDQPTQTQHTGNTNKKEGNKDKEGMKEEREQKPHDPVIAGPEVSVPFESIRSAFPKKSRRIEALRIYSQLAAQENFNHDAILDGATRFAAHCQRERTSERYIPSLDRWLTDGGWENRYDAGAKAGGSDAGSADGGKLGRASRAADAMLRAGA